MLEPEKHDKAERLQQDCSQFTQNAEKLYDVAKTAVEAASERANVVDAEKLRAIGARNNWRGREVSSEHKEKEKAIEDLQEELGRLQEERDSLEKRCEEQELFIARLSDSHVGTG